MNSTRQIKLGAVLSYGVILFNVAAGLIYTPWMVQQIGKSEYGLYVLVTSFLTYFVMDFGLGQAVARFISKYRVDGEETKIEELLGLTTKVYLLIDLIVFSVLATMFFFIGDIFMELTTQELYQFKVIYCIAGVFSVLSFPFTAINGVLVAYERFVILKLCDLLNKIILIALMVLALLMGYKLYALVAINAGVGLILIIIKLIYLAKTTSIKINYGYYNKVVCSRLFSLSAWITVIGVAHRLLLNIAPTILGIMSGSIEIAIFGIGMTIIGYFWTFADALNGLLLLRVSEYSKKTDNMKELSNLMIRIGRIQVFMVGLVVIGIVSMGKEFILLWMGKEFQNSYYVTLLAVVPLGFTVTEEIGNTVLLVVNKLKYQAVLFIIASVISVSISVTLVPRFGAIGAAIGICSGYVLCHGVGMNIVYWKVLKLDIPRFIWECHLKMLVPLGLSLMAGFLIQAHISANRLVTFVPKACLLGLVYFVLMWTIGLNAEEKAMIRSLGSR